MKKLKLRLLASTLFIGTAIMMNSVMINIASAKDISVNQGVGVFAESNDNGQVSDAENNGTDKENKASLNKEQKVTMLEETKASKGKIEKSDLEKTKEKKSFKERVQDILAAKGANEGVQDPNKNQIRAKKNKLTSRLEAKKGELLQTAIGDVDNDGKNENVALYGIKFTKGASYYKELYVVVRDEKNAKVENSFELEFGGYVPRLILSNITAKKSCEIVVSAPTGGSGGMVDYSIWSLKNNFLNEIFSREDNDGIELEGEFLPDYKAKFYFPLAEKAIITDLPRGPRAYIQAGLYDTQGNLLKNHIKPYMQGIINLLPIDTNGDGVSELLFTQKIVGLYSADTLGYVVGSLRYDGYTWNLIDINVRMNLNLENVPDDYIVFGKSGYKIIRNDIKTKSLNVSYPLVSNLRDKSKESVLNAKIEKYVRSIIERVGQGHLILGYTVLEKSEKTLKVIYNGEIKDNIKLETIHEEQIYEL